MNRHKYRSDGGWNSGQAAHTIQSVYKEALKTIKGESRMAEMTDKIVICTSCKEGGRKPTHRVKKDAKTCPVCGHEIA
jgi:rubrerythrin